MSLYEIKTREFYSKKKIPALTLRELDPHNHKIVSEWAMPPIGTRFKDMTGKTFQVKKYLGALLLLEINYGGVMPWGQFLETI